MRDKYAVNCAKKACTELIINLSFLYTSVLFFLAITLPKGVSTQGLLLLKVLS